MVENQVMPNGLHAGSAASSVRVSVGNEAAWELLDGLLTLWLEHESPEDKLQTSWLDDDFGGSDTSEDVLPVLCHGPGVVGIFKPAGVTTEEAVRQLSQQLGHRRHMPKPVDLHVVSRLDHPTSGVLPLGLGAVGSAAANWLGAQFAGRLVRKEYVCLCEGPSLGLTGFQGNVSTPLHTVELDGGRASRTEVSPLGRQAFTGYEVLARYMPPSSSDLSLPSHDREPGVNGHDDERGREGRELMLLRVRPLTGRTHQIRVHMASIGRPLLGDLTYGAKEASVLRSCPRLFLHARRVELRDLAGKPFVAEATLPQELGEVLVQLQHIAEPGAAAAEARAMGVDALTKVLSKRTPKTRKGRKILKLREPQIVEDAKTALVICGNKSSNDVSNMLKDLHSALQAHVGSTLRRNLLDMQEFNVEDFKSMTKFKASTKEAAVGSKPLVIFQGSAFEHDEQLKRAKSLLLDFFGAGKPDQVMLSGLDQVVVCTAVDAMPTAGSSSSVEVSAKIHVRRYRLLMKKSGSKLPRAEVTEIGPHMNLSLDRTKDPDKDRWKMAIKMPKAAKPKKEKNVTTKEMGKRVGKFHLGKQDFNSIHTVHHGESKKKKLKAAVAANSAKGEGANEAATAPQI
ncbi:unnamed protein product [Polarella glacialis]|uniref:Ribosome production factor 2 homolog n=1 Tax=Polarella glacialis TaxID=89957 RepID=A0A813DE55_POLGL|nr:unnamed protein product [Polarella glacialis]